MVPIKTRDEIARMKEAGSILSEIMDVLAVRIDVGVETGALDAAAASAIRSRGVRSAFKGYRGYPANICVSVNEQVVHGIPGKRRLKEGDIVSLDIGIEKGGYYADMAKTFAVGNVDAVKQKLIAATEASLEEAIKALAPKASLSCIAEAIEPFVRKRGFSVVRDFVGHGIGRALHEEPQIPNFIGKGEDVILEDGMVLAIEPMINAGVADVVIMEDGWTAVTKDKKPSAHFEHTVALVDGRAVVLTR